MTVEYINRKGKKYYLHWGQTKTGKPKYFFSTQAEGTLSPTFPEGYEIYENPNAQVFLRKIPRQLIAPEEIAIVREGIEKYANLIDKQDFILDVKEKHLVVYLRDQDAESIARMMEFLSPKELETVLQSASYSPMMRFTLEDRESHGFLVERWCFRGSIDDWIELDYSSNLQQLVKTYCYHLGKDSFYDLC
jgi:hypothetical protein